MILRSVKSKVEVDLSSLIHLRRMIDRIANSDGCEVLADDRESGSNEPEMI